MIVHFFSLQFYVELYELEASQNIKLKQPLYEKRRKVINDKDSHGGESGIEGFWLQVSFYLSFIYINLSTSFHQETPKHCWYIEPRNREKSLTLI